MILRSRVALLVIGLVLLGTGAYYGNYSRRLLRSGETAEGIVFTTSRRTIWVNVSDASTERTRSIPVRRPAFMFARSGQTLTVVHDPKARYDAFILQRQARVRSWRGLWLGPVLLSTAGAACCALYLLGRTGKVDARFELRT